MEINSGDFQHRRLMEFDRLRGFVDGGAGSRWTAHWILRERDTRLHAQRRRPIRLHCLACHGVRHRISSVLDEFESETAFDAKVSVRDSHVHGGPHLYDAIVLRVKRQRAADPAVWTTGCRWVSFTM